MNKLTLLAAGLLLAGPALAQDSTSDDDRPARYASAASFNWDISGAVEAKGSGARLTLGQALNDYVSVEAHFATGGGSDGLRLKRQLGAYLRADWPVSEAVRVFARYGYVETRLEQTVPPGVVVTDVSDRGGSYGAGIELRVLPGVLDGRLSVTADYTVFEEGGGTKADARSVGLRFDLR